MRTTTSRSDPRGRAGTKPTHRFLCPVFLWLLAAIILPVEMAHSGDAAPPSIANSRSSVPAIVIGFVGGFVHPDDPRHSEVQLAQKLRATYADPLRVEIFQNRNRREAHRAILQWLDTDEDGTLSEAEKHGARIVLFGHSWGASAAISLARELQRENIPVLLTVQVDSISKFRQDDRVVPPNVAKAVNFYQTHGLLHGRTKIAAADPTRTEILGDFHFDYKQEPAECKAYPWWDRHLFKGHTAIECDPRIWSHVETLINTYLTEESGPVPNQAAVR